MLVLELDLAKAESEKSNDQSIFLHIGKHDSLNINFYSGNVYIRASLFHFGRED